MSAQGKVFKVNVSASIDTAKEAGNNGTLYIPESEEQGVMIFGGKEFVAVSKGFRTYFEAKLNSEILNKYTVSISHKCITRNAGQQVTTNNNAAFEYGVGGNSNFGYDEESKGYAQCVEITLTIKYNNVLVDIEDKPKLNFRSNFVDEYYVTDGVTQPVFGGSSEGSILMSRQSTGTYKAYFYFSDIVANDDLVNAPTNAIVLHYETNILKYVESEYNISCEKKATGTDIKVPAYFKPEFVINNSDNDNESICQALGTNYYNINLFSRKTSINGTYTLNANKKLHIISKTNNVKIKTALGEIKDCIQATAQVQLGNGTIDTYYVYTLLNSDTYTISK